MIQEPGFKLQAVANPGRIYQAALKPLGDALYNLLPSLSWDCTHNQSKPFDVIQDQLHKGLPTFSVDLSDATSHFPLSLQMEALKPYLVTAMISDYLEIFQRHLGFMLMILSLGKEVNH